MCVFILSKEGHPLMPCSPAIARLLLKEGHAKVKRRVPFTLKLLRETTKYVQPVVAGMDTGSKTLGCAAIANGKVVYQSEITLQQDVSKKMQQRAMYRRNRRYRKTRYRKARWLNRASMRTSGRLAPSIRSKVDSHLREKKQVERILPVLEWRVETASFDIHRITNADVSGVGYQHGDKKGFYNLKAYILHRDGYKCQSKRTCKHGDILQVHHIVFRSEGGTDTPENLLTLCKDCHAAVHTGEFELKARRSKTKHPTQMGIVKSQLKQLMAFTETFGFETKYKREQILHLPKIHANDAVAICCQDGQTVQPSSVLYLKRHVAAGDYQQTKGAHSEKRIPTGKLFGLRKHDLLKTSKGTGFVKGKRSSGYFALETIRGETITASVDVKRQITRLTARTTTLIQRTIAY